MKTKTTKSKTEKKADGKAKGDTAKPAKAKSTKKGRKSAAADADEPAPSVTEAVPASEPTTDAATAVAHAEAPAGVELAPAELDTPAQAGCAAPQGGEAGATTPDEPRLPPVGTVIQKRDRTGAVRCECTVEPEGRIKYRNTLYTSLSGAAAAAAGDLGLTSKSLNGWAWWGLVKPARKEGAVARPRGKDPVKALDKAFAALRTRLNKLLSDELPEEARTKLVSAIKERAEVLAGVARAARGDGHSA